jgi:hypothetical protein
MRINRFPIKSKVIAMALVLTLATSCSGGSNSNALSGDEACQEAIRLMGKGTDVSMKGISDPDGLKANLITLAFEYGQLIKKTDDKSLKAILVQMQSGLKTMSNSQTFFEGNSIYSQQILPLSNKCYGR